MVGRIVPYDRNGAAGQRAIGATPVQSATVKHKRVPGSNDCPVELHTILAAAAAKPIAGSTPQQLF